MGSTLTQQGAFRKERKALERAQKNGLSERDIIMEMTNKMDNPNSAQSVIEAAAAVNYLNALRRKETPITEAVNTLLQPAPGGSGQPA